MGITSSAIMGVLTGIAALLAAIPRSRNDTVAELERHAKAEEDRRRQKQQQEREEEHKRREDEIRHLEEEVRARNRESMKREQEAYEREWQTIKREEEARLQGGIAKAQYEESVRREQEAREKEQQAKDREEEAKHLEELAQKQAEEAKAREGKAKNLEELAQKQIEEAHREKAKAKRREQEAIRDSEEKQRQAAEAAAILQRDIDDANDRLSRGIKPVVWPTMREINDAKLRVQYQDDLLHFAVSGASGSGKSSLINAFRGLKKGEPGAAKVGIVETTLEVTRYPDLRKESPYHRFVWYDVPGAGTSKIPSWQYFNQQGLFIFDFIILVFDARFTQIDADILENCQRFEIPVFIVRSKANQHIENLKSDEDCSYQEARSMFIHETQSNLESNLRDYGLWNDSAPLRCYSVSRECVYDFIKGTEENMWEQHTGMVIADRKGGKKKGEYIDEEVLIRDLLQMALKRRYGSSSSLSRPDASRMVQQGLAKAAAAASSALSKLNIGMQSSGP